MRHYEIVLLVHPDQSGQVPQLLARYKKIITDNKGVVHRLEDSGRKTLAYPINKLNKAHYALINIEADNALLDILNNEFKFNDAVIRNLTIVKKSAVVEPSAFLKEETPKPQYRYDGNNDYARRSE